MKYAQRWVEREPRWVPERRVVDTSLLEVALLSEREAKSFVTTHHYSGSYPAARLRVGLYERGELVGAAIYSEPPNSRTVSAWTRGAYARHEGVELGRFVLLDRVGYNAETFFFARARRLLREHKPDVRVILAYSDPVRREKRDGEVVLPGHIGQIYQAANGAYLGRSSSSTLYLDDDGLVVSRRALSKIIAGDRGERYARARLEIASQTTQRPGESARDWVTRARGGLRRLRHPGNHVYVWGVTRRDTTPSEVPAPRDPDPVQLGLL